MSHKLIPADSLRIQEGYNDLVRSPKETASNAKDVEKLMAQANDNPLLFPIKYVTIGKDKFTRNHATFLAAKARNWEKVYAMESPHQAGSVADIADLITSNNGGHPVSRVAQGQLYKALRDGEPADKETIDATPVGETPKMKREPMTTKQIAEAMTPVYTEQHIKDCIVLADSSPEIRELIEVDSIACGPVITAYQWAKDDAAKALRIIKAAIRHAKEDGREKATKQDMDAIKAEFVTLKAAGGKEKEKKDDAKKAPESADGDNDATLPSGGQESAPERQEEASPEPAKLFSAAPAFDPGTKKGKTLKQIISTVLLECSDEYTWSASDTDIDGATDKIIAAFQNSEVF